MPHYRSMYDNDYIYAFDLMERDVTVTIARVEAKKLKGADGKEDKMPVVYFEGKEKGLALNKTNGKTIAQMYGNNTDSWPGKRVTLYPTTTQAFGETKECIRIRPSIPRDAASTVAQRTGTDGR